MYVLSFLQYSISMAIMLLIEVILVIFVFVFYFMPDTFADIGLYPEDSLDEAITKYREDPDNIVGYCKLLKCEVWDRVKECGQKY